MGRRAESGGRGKGREGGGKRGRMGRLGQDKKWRGERRCRGGGGVGGIREGWVLGGALNALLPAITPLSALDSSFPLCHPPVSPISQKCREILISPAANLGIGKLEQQ